ncbi:unnamed protein product [Lasius platythorax]|uniref:Uncharacterized protein n=1 Tax=Lasius platythorax TaxID=488582 RepID=A0AAV2NXM0_9HYME
MSFRWFDIVPFRDIMISLRASAKASPADEQQQISADSAGRLRPDLPIRNNYTGLIFDQVSCRTRGFNI